MIKKLIETVVLLAGMLFGIVVMYLLAMLIIMMSHQCTFSESLLYMNELDSIRWVQALQTIFVFVLPVLLMLKLFKHPCREYLSLRKAPVNKLLWAMLSILVMMPCMNLIVTWNEQMHLPQAWASIEAWMRQQEAAANAITTLLMSDHSWSGLLMNLLVMSLMTAFAEECLFRGTLQRLLMTDTDKMPHLAIWVTAFIFSAIHLQFYGFFPRLLMGAWLGYLLCWSGSLWLPVAAHACNNAMVVITQFAIAKHYLPEGFGENIGTGATWYLSLISLALIIVLAFYLSDNQLSLKKFFAKRR